jgi:RHS repeat-associated protein
LQGGSGPHYQTGRKNEWQANGKTEREANFGINILETPFRGYDPALGRFHQPDAITDMLPGISSYTFAFNNPVYFNDPTGLAPSDTAAYSGQCPGEKEPNWAFNPSPGSFGGGGGGGSFVGGGGGEPPSNTGNVIFVFGNAPFETRTGLEQSEGNNNWRVIKVKDMVDAVRRLIEYTEGYGSLKNLVLVGHGSAEAFQLGGFGLKKEGLNQLLEGGTFADEGAQAEFDSFKNIGDYMAKDGNVVFMTCFSCFMGPGVTPETSMIASVGRLWGIGTRENSFNIHMNQDYTRGAALSIIKKKVGGIIVDEFNRYRLIDSPESRKMIGYPWPITLTHKDKFRKGWVTLLANGTIQLRPGQAPSLSGSGLPIQWHKMQKAPKR